MKNGIAAITASLVLASMPLAVTTAQAGNPEISVQGKSQNIRVATYNLYVGADIFRVLNPPVCGGALQAVSELFDTVRQTAFHDRAQAIADQIANANPHLIGLQEVSLLRSAPSNILNDDFSFNLGGGGIQFNGDSITFVPDADATVEFDFLQILMAALAERGLDYSIAIGATATNADVEFPMAPFVQFGEACLPVALPVDIRLTDRDVILIRGDVQVDGANAANFRAFVPFQIPATPFPVRINFLRGFGEVSVSVRGQPLHFVNTHLEVGSSDNSNPGLNFVQALQAQELLAVLAGVDKPLIAVGDFNASPEPLDASPAYALMTQVGGFQDAWDLRAAQGGNAMTCCQSETLDNAQSSLVERIDLVLFRFPGSTELDQVQAQVLGDEPDDRTTTALWPSDHAGVVVRFKFRN